MKTHVRLCKLVGNKLTIIMDKLEQDYLLQDVGSPDAEFGFVLDKIDAAGHVEDSYGIELYTKNGYHGCSCRGFVRHSHCKHVESLVALVKAGKIARPVCTTARAS